MYKLNHDMYLIKGFVRYTNADLLSLNCELNEAESDVECLLKDATRKVFADFDER